MKIKAMGKTIIAVFLITVLSLFLTSCSGIVTPELPENLEMQKENETTYVYLDVPYEKYAGANWCLPASGAMTFKYFGQNISQAEIASKVIANGSSSVFKFVSYAKNLGFETTYQLKTLDEIKALLKEGIPVIAIQNYSLSLPYSHARVVIGFDEENQELITNDPTAGKDYVLTYSEFLALNFDSSPTKCKVVVLSPEIDSLNSLANKNTSNDNS